MNSLMFVNLLVDNVLFSEVLALQPPGRADRTYRPNSWWWGGTIFWEGQSANLWYNHDVWYSIGTYVFYDLWHHYEENNMINTERKQTHFVWPIFCSCATLPSIWASYFPISITWSHQGPQKNLILAKYDSSIINCEQCYCPLFATGGHWP